MNTATAVAMMNAVANQQLAATRFHFIAEWRGAWLWVVSDGLRVNRDAETWNEESID